MSYSDVLQGLFNQQRLQIMQLGVHHDEFTDAYLYAWYHGVYPAQEDTDGSVLQMPHEVYEDFFKVKKEQVLKLLTILDDAWLAKEVPTFYALEDQLEARYSPEWDRATLIGICRYLYLQGHSWDENFWNTLLTPMQHPSEAASITKPLSRERDIYFM